MHEGVPIALREDRGGELPAGVAVDAGRIDEEVAGSVLGESLLRVRHRPTWRGSRVGEWRPLLLRIEGVGEELHDGGHVFESVRVMVLTRLHHPLDRTAESL